MWVYVKICQRILDAAFADTVYVPLQNDKYNLL